MNAPNHWSQCEALAASFRARAKNKRQEAERLKIESEQLDRAAGDLDHAIAGDRRFSLGNDSL